MVGNEPDLDALRLQVSLGAAQVVGRVSDLERDMEQPGAVRGGRRRVGTDSDDREVVVIAEREERHPCFVGTRRDIEAEDVGIEALRPLTIANLEHDVSELLNLHDRPLSCERGGTRS